MFIINFDQISKENKINTDKTSCQHNYLGQIDSEISEGLCLFTYSEEKKQCKEGFLQKIGCYEGSLTVY